MSNSSLVTYKKLSPNYTKMTNKKNKKLVIHHVAGKLSVKQIGNIFASPSRQASSNYAIDNDGNVGLYVDESNRSWATANREVDSQAITIEVANSKTGGDWPVSAKAMAKLIDLCVDICKRNGIKELNYTGDKSGNLVMHCWYAATACPGPYLKSKFPYIAQEVNKRLKPSAKKTTTTKKVTIPKKVKSKVVTASIKAKGKNYKITDHFALYEFQCHNGADTVKYDMQIVTALEAARLFFNVPITISSAYRPASYNKKVGGATKSYHVYGKAVDHYCKLSYSMLAKFYEVYGLKGIGCYYDDHFVHIDSRTTKFLWNNQSSTKVSTHLVTVKSGNDSRHVSDLQWLLKHKHGFDIKIDGEFGAKTKAAVIAFQKKKKLSADGIVGKKTWTKLLAI